jgi:hypothetical protein
MDDHGNPPSGSWIRPDSASKKHRGFLNLIFLDDQLRQFRERHGVQGLLDKMSAQQSLGIAAIASMQRSCCLLKDQL